MKLRRLNSGVTGLTLFKPLPIYLEAQDGKGKSSKSKPKKRKK